MLSSSVQKKIIAAFFNLLFLGVVGLLLLYLQNLFLPEYETRRIETTEIWAGIFFYCLLIYLLYALIFVIILNNFRVPDLTKAIVCSLGGTILIYVFGYSFGGSGNLQNIRLLSFLFTVLILGFLLPFT